MDCPTACRTLQTHSAPKACPSGTQSVQCVVKGSTKPAYVCGPTGSEATQFCHPPSTSTHRATNVRRG